MCGWSNEDEGVRGTRDAETGTPPASPLTHSQTPSSCPVAHTACLASKIDSSYTAPPALLLKREAAWESVSAANLWGRISRYTTPNQSLTYIDMKREGRPESHGVSEGMLAEGGLGGRTGSCWSSSTTKLSEVSSLHRSSTARFLTTTKDTFRPYEISQVSLPYNMR